MESSAETERLVAQEEAEETEAIFDRCGLGPGMRVLDAGCGPGVIARRIAERVGPEGEVVGVDASAERVSAAARHNEGLRHARFERADIHALPFEDGRFDFVWSQFVFEYLPDPMRALRELIRVARPGGKIVVSDIDGMGSMAWPIAPDVSAGFEKLAAAVAASGFDLHIGRKLYSHFRAAGLVDLRVHLFPQYLIAGRAPDRLVQDWRIRFDALARTGESALGGSRAYARFVDRFIEHLEDAGALKFGIVLVTQGTRR